MGSAVNWSPFSSQGALFNQASVFSIKLCIPTPLGPLPQLLPCLSYKKDRKVKRESQRLNFPVWTPSTSLWIQIFQQKEGISDLCANPNTWIWSHWGTSTIISGCGLGLGSKSCAWVQEGICSVFRTLRDCKPQGVIIHSASKEASSKLQGIGNKHVFTVTGYGHLWVPIHAANECIRKGNEQGKAEG